MSNTQQANMKSEKQTEKHVLLNKETIVDNTEPHGRTGILVAYIAAFLSIITVSISLPCVQILNGVVPEFELNAWRFAAQVFLVAPVVMKHKCDVWILLKKWPVMIVICILYTMFNLTYYTSALYLPVETLDGLNSTVVIITNMLLSICIKADRKPCLYLSAGLSITGILLLTQPEFMFNSHVRSNQSFTTTTSWISPCTNSTTEESTVTSQGTTRWQRIRPYSYCWSYQCRRVSNDPLFC